MWKTELIKTHEETLCDKCAHSAVCKHKDILAAVNERIDKLSISKEDGSRTTVTMIRDIEFVDIWATCNCFMCARIPRTDIQLSNIRAE